MARRRRRRWRRDLPSVEPCLGRHRFVRCTGRLHLDRHRRRRPVAPGPALTIRDLGAGVAFPVTNYGTGTGALTLEGTFDTSVLGGSPTTLQAQVSISAGGPPVAGCSACAWTNLTGYGATLRSGTVYDWKGQALNIPASAGPVSVSVRAANGTGYATMPTLIKVGLIFDWNAEGQGGALASNQGGSSISSFLGFWGLNAWVSPMNLTRGRRSSATGSRL